MANNRTLRVVVSADPKPSLSQLEKDIQALSSQLASGGSKIVVPVEISGFKADKAIDKLKTDIENALKNMSVNINGIQVTGGSGGSGNGGSGGSGGKKSNDIIDESSLKSKQISYYYSNSKDAIKQIRAELDQANIVIDNIKTSTVKANGEVNGFSVEIKDAVGNTEKLDYALKQVKDSAGQVKNAYVQIKKVSSDDSNNTKKENAIKHNIIDESSINGKVYSPDSATAIKEVQNELIAAGQSIKNIKTSIKETNGEVSGFVVEMKNALGNTEKLEYALKQVKDSAGQVKDAYVQIGKSTVNNSGGTLGLTEIKNEIASIEGSLDFDSLTKGLDNTQVNTVRRSFIDLKDAIDSAKNSTGGLNESTLNYIKSLNDAMNKQVIAFRDENYRNSPVDNSWDDSSRLKQTADSVTLLRDKYESLNEKYKMSGEILETVRVRMEAIRNAQTNGARDDNLFGFDKYIESADEMLNVVAKIDNQYEMLVSKAKNMNLNEGASDELSSLEASMNRLRNLDMSDGASAWNKALSETQFRMSNLTNLVKEIKVDESAKKSFDQQRASVTNLQTSIEKAKNSLEDFYKKNTKLAQNPEFVNNYKAIMNRDYGNSREGYAQLAQDVNRYKAAAKEAGLETQTLGDKIYAAYKKFGGWAIVTQTMSKAVAMFKSMVSNVVELDTAMTELYKVTNETKDVYAQFLSGSADTAREVGATMTDVINSTADFARLGYSLSDSEELAKAALIYKSVGDGIKDVDEASQSIISTMKAFGVEAENAMTIVDEMNYTGNNFAISSAGIGDALIRSASALSAAGNTMEQSIALITAMNSTVQDTDKVGTTLKTLTMYLRAAKTEAESAGESTEGMASSVSKLREDILSLTNNKVDIMLDSENFKSTYQIMQEISDVWNDIADVDQANLLELLGGKRNSDAVVSLIKNFQTAKDVMDGLGESAGSADRELATFKDSIEGRMTDLRTSFQQLSSTVVNSDLIKNVVSGGDSVLQVLNKITQTIGTIPGIVTGIGAILSKNDLGIWSASGTGFGERLSKQLFKIDYKSAIPEIEKYNTALNDTSKNMQGVIDDIKKTNNSLGTFIQSVYKVDASVEANTVTLDMYKTSMSSLGTVAKVAITIFKNLAMSFAIGLAIQAVSIGINALVEHIKSLSYTAEEAKEALEDFNSTQSGITNNISKINELKSRYEELAKGVDENGKNVSLTKEEYDEFKSIVDKIIEISPNVVKAYNAQGEALLNYKNLIEESTDSLKEMSEQETSAYLAEYPKVYKGQKKNFNENADALSDTIRSTNISDVDAIGKVITAFFQKGFKTDPINQVIKVLEKAGISIENATDKIYGSVSFTLKDQLQIADNYKQLLTVLKGVTDESGNSLFDSDQIKNFETAFSAVDAAADKVRGSISDIVDGMKPWIQSQDWFSKIPEEKLADYYEAIANRILELGDNINSIDSNRVKEIAEEFKGAFTPNISPQKKSQLDEMLGIVKELGDIDIGDNSSINKAIDDYTKAADVANRLRKEYRETGKISVDTYLELAKSSEDFSKILEVEGDAYTINDNELKKYIDTKRDAAIESEINNGATSDEIAALIKYGTTVSSISPLIGDYQEKLSGMAKILKDNTEGTQYTREEVDKLLESYPELTFEVDESTGMFKLQEKSLDSLNKMIKNVIDSIVSLSQEMMKLQGIDILTNMYGQGETNAKNQYDTYFENVKENDIDSFEKWVEKYGKPSVNEEAIKQAISSYALEKAYADALENADFSNMLTEKSTSGSGKKTDAYKEKFEEWYKTQQHYLNTGRILEEDYYNALEAMNISYFAGKKKYLDEFRKYEQEVYKGRQSLVSDTLTKIDDEYVKHGSNSEAIKQIEALTEKYRDVIDPKLQKTIDTKKLSYTVALYGEQSDELKKQLDLLEEQEGSQKEQIEIYQRLQDEVINLSSYYKSIGYADDSDALKDLEDQWIEYANKIKKLAKDMYDDIQDARKNALKRANEDLKEQTDALDDILDMVVDSIKQQKKDEIDALKEEKDDISDHYDDLKEEAQDYWDDLKDKENDSYDYRKETTKKYYEDLIDNIKKAKEASTKALDEELDKYKKLIDAKKESLQEAKDEEDYNKKVAEMNKNISSIQGQIDLLALDNSQEARAKRLDLEQQLADAMNELAEYQAEYALDKQLDALDKEYDAFEESINKQKDLIEEKADNDVEMYEKERDAKLDAIEKVHDAEIDSIAKRKKEALRRIEDEKDAEIKAYENKIKALEDYLDEEGTLYREANEIIRSEGENLWNAMSEYCKKYEKDIHALEEAWKKVLKAVAEYGDGDYDVIGIRDNLKDKQEENDDEIDKIEDMDDNTYQKLVDETRKAMRINSEDWWMTNNAETKRDLSNANKELAKAFNDSVGYEALTYDPKKGIWLLDGVRFYHEGGIVGSKNKKLKNDETFAVLKDGEAVYTSKMQDTIGRFIDFAKNITNGIGSVISVKDPAKYIARNFERDVMPRYSSDVVIDHLFEFKADNVTSESLPETEKMMKRVSEYTIGLLEDRLTRRGLKAKIKGAAI